MPLPGSPFPAPPTPSPGPAPPTGTTCPPGFSGMPPNCVLSGFQTFVDDGNDGPAPISNPDQGGGSSPAGPSPIIPPSGSGGTMPTGGCDPHRLYKTGHPCAPNPGNVPVERGADDLPCGASLCKDVVTGQCRSFNPNREKVNMTDQWERESGGGRGYCRKKDGGGAGGSGGAGGAGGAGGSGGSGGSRGHGNRGDGGDFASLLEDYLRQGMAAPSRYTPEALQALYGQTTQQASSQIARGSAAVRADAARRGMSRSGGVAAGLRDVRAGAEAQRGTANVGIMRDKINADYQDKASALERAQRYLDSLRDNEYRYALLGEQRRQFDANLTLAYANIQSQWDMLQAQFGQQLVLGGV